MSKHTPGPWYADKLQDRCAFNIFPHGASLALLEVAGPAHDGAHAYAQAAEANARLIAAAPELLDALTALLPMFADWHKEFSDHVGDKEGPALDAARAAIAKATGEPA